MHDIRPSDRPNEGMPSHLMQIRDWGENYLRLFRLDLNDLEQVISFVNQLGVVGLRFGNLMDGPYFDYKQGGYAMYLAVSEIRPKRTAKGRKDFMKTIGHGRFERATRALEATGREDVIVGETLHDFRRGAQMVRDLVRAWQIVSDQVRPEDMLDEWETPYLWPTNKSPDGLLNDPLNPKHSAMLLRMALSTGDWSALTPFHPQLGYNHPSDPIGVTDQPPLYNLLCLELFNHIVEGLPYRACAAERCGNLFIRQRGRAKHRQHRTRGVMYCSSSCANAEAQRKYRRRQARARSKAAQA